MDVDKGGSMNAMQVASECLRKPEIKRVRVQFCEGAFKEYVEVFCCHINWSDIAGEHTVTIPCGTPAEWNVRYRCIKKCLDFDYFLIDLETTVYSYLNATLTDFYNQKTASEEVPVSAAELKRVRWKRIEECLKVMVVAFVKAYSGEALRGKAPESRR